MRLAIIGGDIRMLAAGRLMRECGIECRCFGHGEHARRFAGIISASDIKTAAEGADAVLLPFPCIKNGYINAPLIDTRIRPEDVFLLGDEKTLYLGGGAVSGVKNYVDYAQREDFLLKNAIPTAEGAIAIAINETKTTLKDANALVLGFGRIGGYLAYMLKALGANVTVVARRIESRAKAEMYGINAVGFEDIEAPLKCADILFNTVPYRVLGEKELSALKKGTAVIELASFPGGADEETARVYNVNLIKALGLPGKVAPLSAGKAVFDAATAILTERGLMK